VWTWASAGAGPYHPAIEARSGRWRGDGALNWWRSGQRRRRPASHGGMKARVRVGGERGRAEAGCQALVRRDRRQTREREQEESRRDTKRKKRAGGTQRF
jgi:hypothetical protein